MMMRPLERATMSDIADEPPSLPPSPATPSSGRGQQPPRRKRDVHGWVVLDKPVGMTSTHAVAVVKRVLHAKKAGHAGTLDPLASGLLPIALGEATKTVPFVMDGRKAYQFTVTWGSQTDTDDTEGSVTATSEARPDEAAILAVLPRFSGDIMQVPPRFSAIKIAGERAYDLARGGEVVELEARPVRIDRLTLISHTPDHSVFEAECGKGTYVRAIARDLGLAIGCYGHVSALRRTRVGPFNTDRSISLEDLQKAGQAAPGEALAAVLPVDAALDDLPSVAVSRPDAARLARGQGVLLRGRDAPIIEGPLSVTCQGRLVAVADIAGGEIVPRRVFNLSGGL
ncbi:MAG: tRNA pseudouridine(55) synthase TruB [Chelatococcus sp.]|uniref:tRNA pseudouridine(55) synthase TruB n=1 Tax=Chelatococcus sp. TaxID=1953771 RepID=UPI0025BC37AC|nr:tRNA pseudouridine(55) synthase TruB [Chelatococcus sp.]MBX3538077.1 tRNA pseudouridine(55) synthase TruB [Chelatococcus sp.]